MNILFLCTGNSARSILAEAVMRDLAGPRVRAFSAGSAPKGAPHPEALATLARHGHDLNGLSSKSWDVFAADGAPTMDAVVTVCANAAGETCPIWPVAPGQQPPARGHWDAPDPPLAGPDPVRLRGAFEAVYALTRTRVECFVALTAEAPALDRAGLSALLAQIAAETPAPDILESSA